MGRSNTNYYFHLAFNKIFNFDEFSKIDKKTTKIKNHFESILKLLELKTPNSSLENFSFKQIEKFTRLEPKDKDVQFGYSLKNTECIDIPKILEQVDTFQHFFFLCATSENEDDFVKENSQFIHSEEIARRYIIHKENWGEKNYKANQIKYGNFLHSGVLVAAAAIEQKRWNFYQLLMFLGFHRYKIAKEARTDDATDYGILQCNTHTSRCTTSCKPGSFYEDLALRLLGLHRHKIAKEAATDGAPVNRILQCNTHINKPIGSFYENLALRLNGLISKWIENKQENYNIHDNRIEIEIKDEKIPLTEFKIEADGLIVEHPRYLDALKILKVVSILFDKCLKEENHPKLLKKLGKMFWLICQAKPWVKGDPSIAEMLIKAIWLHKTGKLLPPWQKGLVPWESVIEETCPNRYGSNFIKCFAENPIR